MAQKRIYQKINGRCLDQLELPEIEAPFKQIRQVKVKSTSDFQTKLIVATVFLLALGAVLYIVALLNIDSHVTPVPSHLASTNKSAHLRDVEENRTSIQNKETSNLDQKPISNLSFVQKWIQRIKKLSTEISAGKLIRARQMLKQLSMPPSQKVYREEYEAFMRDYQINRFAQKSMCIVIPTYNNMKDGRWQKNIESILRQDYTNYKAIVIDDASDDGTGQAIQSYLSTHRAYRSGRITVQTNQQRKMALGNILDAAENYCEENDIFIVIDGDDYLLGKYVLKLFNAAFSSRDAWVVYSNFLTPTDKIGYSRRYPTEIIQSREFRRVLFIISHLRAFYTKLLLSIKKSDLQDENGEYFRAANDVAIFMPILEMASDHIIYLPQISYFYNSNTGMNNHQEKKKEQIKNDRLVRGRPKYQKVDKLLPEAMRVHFYEESAQF